MPHLARHNTHFLVVDDDPLSVLNVERAFACASPARQIWTAIDGRDALATLRGDAMPVGRRIVLLDVHMPRMDGITMLRELRADPTLQNTIVVMLTASRDPADRGDAFDLKVAGYLVKPSRFATLVAMVGALSSYWAATELPIPAPP